MKLRLRPNSIRLRLGRSDVRALLEHGSCRHEISFGGSTDATLRYALSMSDSSEISASFRDGEIIVVVPRGQARHWASGDEVGIETSQPTAGGPLKILIEKDFACIDGNSGEPQEDAFPNPGAAGCGSPRD